MAGAVGRGRSEHDGRVGASERHVPRHFEGRCRIRAHRFAIDKERDRPHSDVVTGGCLDEDIASLDEARAVARHRNRHVWRIVLAGAHRERGRKGFVAKCIQSPGRHLQGATGVFRDLVAVAEGRHRVGEHRRSVDDEIDAVHRDVVGGLHRDAHRYPFGKRGVGTRGENRDDRRVVGNDVVFVDSRRLVAVPVGRPHRVVYRLPGAAVELVERHPLGDRNTQIGQQRQPEFRRNRGDVHEVHRPHEIVGRRESVLFEDLARPCHTEGSVAVRRHVVPDLELPHVRLIRRCGADRDQRSLDEVGVVCRCEHLQFRRHGVRHHLESPYRTRHVAQNVGYPHAHLDPDLAIVLGAFREQRRRHRNLLREGPHPPLPVILDAVYRGYLPDPERNQLVVGHPSSFLLTHFGHRRRSSAAAKRRHCLSFDKKLERFDPHVVHGDRTHQ